MARMEVVSEQPQWSELDIEETVQLPFQNTQMFINNSCTHLSMLQIQEESI